MKFVTQADQMQSRAEALDATMRYYGTMHAEDKRDGTAFDNEVLDALMELKVKHCISKKKGV